MILNSALRALALLYAVICFASSAGEEHRSHLLDPPTNKAVIRLLKEAKRLSVVGKADEASALLLDYMERHPKDPETVHVQLLRVEIAVEQSNDPETAAYLRRKASELLAAGKNEEGRALLRKAFIRFPDTEAGAEAMVVWTWSEGHHDPENALKVLAENVGRTTQIKNRGTLEALIRHLQHQVKKKGIEPPAVVLPLAYNGKSMAQWAEILKTGKGQLNDAARALGEIGPAALPLLRPLLKGPRSSVREHSATAIARMEERGQEAVSDILPLLRDRDESVRSSAVWALKAMRVDTDEVIDALKRVVQDDAQVDEDTVADDAAEALGYLGEKGRAAFRSMLSSDRPEVQCALIDGMSCWDDLDAKTVSAMADAAIKSCPPWTADVRSSCLSEIDDWVDEWVEFPLKKALNGQDLDKDEAANLPSAIALLPKVNELAKKMRKDPDEHLRKTARELEEMVASAMALVEKRKSKKR